MNLTKRFIDSIEYIGPIPRRHIEWDDIPGFGIRIYPKIKKGKKSRKAFVLNYRFCGRERLMTLGTYGVITLIQARDDAREYLVGLKKGIDPLAERKKLTQGEDVKALCDAYLERYAKLKKKSWQEDKRRINNRIVPAWGNHKAKNINHDDVVSLHNRIGKKHPYEANRVIELISKMFDLARRWDYVPKGFVNPARDIDMFTEKARDRWVTPEELPKLAEAIDAEENTYARYALWLYLLTGARKTEVLTAKWADIDWDRKELRLPKTKSGRIHYTPLSEPAIELLKGIPQIKGNPYVLPGRKPGAHLVNIHKPWTRVRKAAGVEDVRLHDLRRTVGSWLAQSGNSLHLIGRVLNHSSQATTAVYARFGQDQVRDALEQHGKKIMGVAKKKPTADIVEIKK